MFPKHQYSAILAVLAGSSLVHAHGHITQWTVGGRTYEGFDPNQPNDYQGAQRPTDNGEDTGKAWGPANMNLATGEAENTFTAMVACGGASSGSGLETWSLEAGSEVTATWTSNWPPAHLGPVLEYMARCPGTDCNGVAPETLDWFKIGQMAYEDGQWASQRIMADPNWTFKIPADIAPGPYLVRHEIMALHFENWQEIYPVCFQADVTGSGTAVPTDTAKIPALYEPENYPWLDYSDPWDGRDPALYIPPGPAVYTGGAGSGTGAGTGGAVSGNSTASPAAGVSASASMPVEVPSTPSSGGSDEEEAPSSTESEYEDAPAVTAMPENGEVESPAASEEPSESSIASDESGDSSSSRRWGSGRWRTRTGSRKTTAAAPEPTEDPESEDAVSDDSEEEEEEYKRSL